MLLYADEDFPFPAVEELRRLGHDVVTAQEDGRRAEPDSRILERARQLGRAVVTHNRRDYERLHRQGADHCGIVSTKHDHRNPIALASRIHGALAGKAPGRWAIRVNRPAKP